MEEVDSSVRPRKTFLLLLPLLLVLEPLSNLSPSKSLSSLLEANEPNDAADPSVLFFVEE